MVLIADSEATVGLKAETLRICYVLGAFPVLSETFVSNEIRALRDLGHSVIIATLSEHRGSYQPEDEDLKQEVVRCDTISARLALTGAMRRPDRLTSALFFAFRQTGIRPRSILLAGARAAAIASAARCDHIHAHFANVPAATAIVAGRIAGMTCSFTGHGYDVYGSPHDLALKLASANFAVAVCRDMADDFHALCSSASVTTVHCGVDPERFAPTNGNRNGKLLAIGRLAPQKGYDVLLSALARIPTHQRPIVDAVGGGALLEPMRAEAARLGISDSINFLGPRPASWIAEFGPAYLGFLAPYVITSDGDRDTGPVVVKEAMAMGLPVVASALMGLKEIVSTESGRLVQPGDAHALAEAI